MSGGRRDGITTLSFFLVAVGQDFLTQFNDLFPEGHWFAGRGGHGDETRGGLGVMWATTTVMEGGFEYQDGVAMARRVPRGNKSLLKRQVLDSWLFFFKWSVDNI
jgi:hypothetical protein